ncbi:MAG: hypothetical protein BZ138_02965 [Methanosphaera sp. rholeuAM270]|nr:MAG: hypothetical protein BZ138_02965 [Methanosphaera sp. rholeuAM270]
MKQFTCIFPGLYNYILTKDVGMIPYTLSKRYMTSIATYDNDKYYYLDNILKSEQFSIDYLEHTGNEKNDVIRYIKENAEQIDILQLYHLRYNVLPHYIFNYRTRNRKGKIFLKLDANNEFIDFLMKRKGFFPSIRRLSVKLMFKFIDLVSIETIRNYEVLKEGNIISNDKLLYLPNGILETRAGIDSKEHQILYVGVIEKKNKSIDMLLNAVRDVDLKDWNIILIGEIQEDMTEFINDYFDDNPQLKDKITFKGYVSDKEILAREYAKSSIYCCTSIKESFGISTLEAAYHANYIISTNVGGSPDIIKQSRYGTIIEHDENALRRSIETTINNWDSIKQDPHIIQKRVSDEFNWNYLCKKIIKKIED